MGKKVYITSDMAFDDQLAEIAEEDPTAALMWPWILTSLDDWGRGNASPKRLKRQIFSAFATITTETIARALRQFSDAGILILYGSSERPLMAVAHDKWFAYQTHIRGEKRDKDGSRYPSPPSVESAQQRADARNDAQMCASPSPSLSPPLSFEDADASSCPNTPQNVVSDAAIDDSDNGLPHAAKPKGRRKLAYTDADMELAARLRDRIAANVPLAPPKANSLPAWANEIRLMREQDGLSPPLIAEVIDWAQTDSFWRGVILSADKLRKHFTALVDKKNGHERPKTGGVNNRGAPRRDSGTRYDAIVEH